MATTLTAEQLQRLGRDLAVTYGSGDGRHSNLDLDVRVNRRQGGIRLDLAVADGVDNALQGIVHRINTTRGELAPLGHPDYGSRHHELVGEPNTEHNRQLVKLYLLQALAEEPRIEQVRKAVIRFDRGLDPSRVDVELEVALGATGEVVNLVVPFVFEDAS